MYAQRLLEAHDPDGLALMCSGASRSWAELRAGAGAVETHLRARIEPGDVVVVFGETSIGFVEALLGALAAGAAVLPLHGRYPVAEVQRACRAADPACIVVTDEVPTAADMVDGLAPDVVGLSALVAGETSAEARTAEADPNAPGLLLFTSGTAGSPRLAMLSRANVEASISSTIQSSPTLADSDNVVLGVVPLTHVLGLVSVLGVSLATGATLVLAPDPRPETIVDLVERHRVSLLVAPPIFWYRLAEAAPEAARLSSVRIGLSGAAPLQGALAKRVENDLGLRLRQGYGLTEASPALTTSVDTQAPATSVGRPVPGVELRLVDEFGDDALVGDVGEVWARGANIFLGYLGDPEATAAVVDDDGWLRTGDLAVVDEAGHLFIVGRSKDQIICAGFNVHPGEVEDWVIQHASVAEAAVVGEPDREYGEVVVAFIVGAAGAVVDDEELRAHCRERLAGYKVPARFVVVDELPRSAAGKLRRRALRPG